MTGLPSPGELRYTRLSAGVGDLLGGGDEHWEIFAADGGVVATVTETDLTVLRRAGRFLNNLFPYQQARSLEVRSTEGETLLAIVKPSPKPGLEYAEVRTHDGAPAGTVRLTEVHGTDRLGLGLFGVNDERLAEVRYSSERTSASGHRTFDLVTADGSAIGEMASTKTRGGGGPVGYRLRVDRELADPLRSLVHAAPIIRHFIN